jgi:hypothetical protein
MANVSDRAKDEEMEAIKLSRRYRDERDKARAALEMVELNSTGQCLWCNSWIRTSYGDELNSHKPDCQRQIGLGLTELGE